MTAVRAPKAVNTLWQQPGAEARVVQLWTVGKLSRNAVADIMAREFGHRITGRGVEGHLERLGYKDGARALPQDSLIESAISLPSVAGKYLYSRGRLIRDGVALEVRQS